ncbi:GNAT family N-acetyltransferase [Neolewinella agarilytica]|nr:GNAT family N-acetyltransferase [Neolewinella agarilytica]
MKFPFLSGKMNDYFEVGYLDGCLLREAAIVLIQLMLPTFSTSRLIIRPFLPEDSNDIFRLNGNRKVMQFLPRDEFFGSQAEASHFLESYIRKSEEVAFVRQAVIRRSDGKWLGWCGLREQKDGEVDLGFRFHESEWGNGYATESGLAWLEYGFNEGQLSEIVANAAVGNVGSQKVLAKLGFLRHEREDHTEDGFRWLRYRINKNRYQKESVSQTM